ncbi:axon ensheathment [Trichomonas vaginalis G3]|uniref:axon ensheathment n=1 Tax=Trichomonas vaginalis (strain ATCC PRA-98 / G3) TaxID=412133 RepID=UPI0021E5EC4E|nr:axon ensheathment [Trichomonas vaginalis G3]KAI5491044.1 axon ensheathment [Trichomonas vaginalis G3]
MIPEHKKCVIGAINAITPSSKGKDKPCILVATRRGLYFFRHGILGFGATLRECYFILNIESIEYIDETTREFRIHKKRPIKFASEDIDVLVEALLMAAADFCFGSSLPHQISLLEYPQGEKPECPKVTRHDKLTMSRYKNVCIINDDKKDISHLCALEIYENSNKTTFYIDNIAAQPVNTEQLSYSIAHEGTVHTVVCQSFAPQNVCLMLKQIMKISRSVRSLELIDYDDLFFEVGRFGKIKNAVVNSLSIIRCFKNPVRLIQFLMEFRFYRNSFQKLVIDSCRLNLKCAKELSKILQTFHCFRALEILVLKNIETDPKEKNAAYISIFNASQNLTFLSQFSIEFWSPKIQITPEISNLSLKYITQLSLSNCVMTDIPDPVFCSTIKRFSFNGTSFSYRTLQLVMDALNKHPIPFVLDLTDADITIKDWQIYFEKNGGHFTDKCYELNWSGNPIIPQNISYLTNYFIRSPNLKYLDISRCFTTKSLKVLDEFFQSINGIPLWGLGFDADTKTSLGSEIIQRIMKIPTLVVLSVNGQNLKAKDIKDLMRLPQLGELSCDGTTIDTHKDLFELYDNVLLKRDTIFALLPPINDVYKIRETDDREIVQFRNRCAEKLLPGDDIVRSEYYNDHGNDMRLYKRYLGTFPVSRRKGTVRDKYAFFDYVQRQCYESSLHQTVVEKVKNSFNDEQCVHFNSVYVVPNEKAETPFEEPDWLQFIIKENKIRKKNNFVPIPAPPLEGEEEINTQPLTTDLDTTTNDNEEEKEKENNQENQEQKPEQKEVVPEKVEEKVEEKVPENVQEKAQEEQVNNNVEQIIFPNSNENDKEKDKVSVKSENSSVKIIPPKDSVSLGGDPTNALAVSQRSSTVGDNSSRIDINISSDSESYPYYSTSESKSHKSNKSLPKSPIDKLAEQDHLSTNSRPQIIQTNEQEADNKSVSQTKVVLPPKDDKTYSYPLEEEEEEEEEEIGSDESSIIRAEIKYSQKMSRKLLSTPPKSPFYMRTPRPEPLQEGEFNSDDERELAASVAASEMERDDDLVEIDTPIVSGLIVRPIPVRPGPHDFGSVKSRGLDEGNHDNKDQEKELLALPSIGGIYGRILQQQKQVTITADDNVSSDSDESKFEKSRGRFSSPKFTKKVKEEDNESKNEKTLGEVDAQLPLPRSGIQGNQRFKLFPFEKTRNKKQKVMPSGLVIIPDEILTGSSDTSDSDIVPIFKEQKSPDGKSPRNLRQRKRSTAAASPSNKDEKEDNEVKSRDVNKPEQVDDDNDKKPEEEKQTPKEESKEKTKTNTIDDKELSKTRTKTRTNTYDDDNDQTKTKTRTNTYEYNDRTKSKTKTRTRTHTNTYDDSYDSYSDYEDTNERKMKYKGRRNHRKPNNRRRNHRHHRTYDYSDYDSYPYSDYDSYTDYSDEYDDYSYSEERDRRNRRNKRPNKNRYNRRHNHHRNRRHHTYQSRDYTISKDNKSSSDNESLESLRNVSEVSLHNTYTKTNTKAYTNTNNDGSNNNDSRDMIIVNASSDAEFVTVSTIESGDEVFQFVSVSTTTTTDNEGDAVQWIKAPTLDEEDLHELVTTTETNENKEENNENKDEAKTKTNENTKETKTNSESSEEEEIEEEEEEDFEEEDSEEEEQTRTETATKENEENKEENDSKEKEPEHEKEQANSSDYSISNSKTTTTNEQENDSDKSEESNTKTNEDDEKEENQNDENKEEEKSDSSSSKSEEEKEKERKEENKDKEKKELLSDKSSNSYPEEEEEEDFEEEDDEEEKSETTSSHDESNKPEDENKQNEQEQEENKEEKSETSSSQESIKSEEGKQQKEKEESETSSSSQESIKSEKVNKESSDENKENFKEREISRDQEKDKPKDTSSLSEYFFENNGKKNISILSSVYQRTQKYDEHSSPLFTTERPPSHSVSIIEVSPSFVTTKHDFVSSPVVGFHNNISILDNNEDTKKKHRTRKTKK